MNLQEMKKAVIYARYSSNNQREESIDAQIRACTKYAEEKGYRIIGTYTDSAKSATTADRPQFQQMLKDSEKKTFQYVIIHKLDRFSRDRYDSVTCKRKLKLNGVQLISVLENIDGSPESLIMETLLEGMAEYYSKNLAREVAKGQLETALQCKHLGGYAPLGYAVDPVTKKYIINEEEAEIVKTIFRMYIEGVGYKQLLHHLNSNGYKTRTGKMFGLNSLNTILKNEKYTGVYIFNKKKEKDESRRRRPRNKPEEEVIKIEGGMPKIIEKKDFEIVQEKMRGNKERAGQHKAKRTYLLSGIVFCGVCGAPMYGNSRKGGRSKLVYNSYRCSNRNEKKGCGNKELRKEYLEEYVLEQLEKTMFSERGVKNLASRLIAYNNERTQNQSKEMNESMRRIKEIEEEIEKILDLVVASGISVDTVGKKLKTLEQEKEEVEEKMGRLVRASRQVSVDEETVKLLIDQSKVALKSKDLTECKKVLNNYIEKVVVFEDIVEVHFKFQVQEKELDKKIIPMKRKEEIKYLQEKYREVNN